MVSHINSLRVVGIQARDIYPELKKYFYKEHSNVTWEEFLVKKIALWIDTPSDTNNALHGSGRAVQLVYHFRSKKHLRLVAVI